MTGRSWSFVVAPAEVAGPVHERDDVQRQDLVRRPQLQVRQLLGQVVLQRLRPLDDVLHRVELAVAQLVERRPARPVLVFVEGPVPVAVSASSRLNSSSAPGSVASCLSGASGLNFSSAGVPFASAADPPLPPRPRPLRPTPLP